VVVDNPTQGFALAALAGAYAWTGHDKEAKDAVDQRKKVAPTCTVQLWQHRVSDDPTFNAQMDRAVEGLRRAGVPRDQRRRIESGPSAQRNSAQDQELVRAKGSPLASWLPPRQAGAAAKSRTALT
jgi:hypothetical protein